MANTKIGMLSTRLTADERTKMHNLAERGARLCKDVNTRGGALLQLLFSYLSRLTVAHASLELQLTHATRELRELRAQLDCMRREELHHTPVERFEEPTRNESVNPYLAGSHRDA